jgi:hypothetical protein
MSKVFQIGLVGVCVLILGACGSTMKVEHTYKPASNENFTFGSTPCIAQATAKAREALGRDTIDIINSDESIVVDVKSKSAVVECYVEVTK